MALPFLPGNTFTDPTKAAFHKTQTLGYKNGYSIPVVGGANPLNDEELEELVKYKPSLTYGQAAQAPEEPFVPAAVAFDKKVLLFSAYFKQTVHESSAESYCIRPVKIFYYLEDDSISVVEPVVENSGIPQGVLLRRQRVPKNDVGDFYIWKDLNLGIEVTFYGKAFKIYDCNGWTREYMASEGIVLNPAEACPVDPYSSKRVEEQEIKMYTTPNDFDSLKQFKENDRKVLRFYCSWDDSESMYGEVRKFVLHYYLVDSTLELREIRYNNDGRESFPVFIGRQKMPLDRNNVPESFPSIVLEKSDHEIKDYFGPEHLKTGESVYIMDRWFYIHDCDKFTAMYYAANYGVRQESIEVSEPETETITPKEIPAYDGFGGLEDSLQTCLNLVPKPPKKDYIKMLENMNNILRYELRLESTRPEDKLRKFIMSYRLSDDMITIYEKAQRNSGVIGGKFLRSTRVTKPGSTVENVTFYTLADFEIGAKIEIFAHRFTIVNADVYVLKHLQSVEAGTIPLTTINSLREKYGKKPLEDFAPYEDEE